jgi:hypothetical protein
MSLLKEEIELAAQQTELEIKLQLSEFPKWKKWLLIFGLVAVIPAYFIAKNRSHTYWQKKYAPLIVTVKKPLEEPQAPEIGQVQFVDNGNKTYSAIVPVTNPNLDLSAHDVPIEVEFYNANGETIGTPFKDTVYILPGSEQYIVISRLPAEQPARLNVVIPPNIHWQRRLFLPEVAISATTPTISFVTSPVGTIVTGGIRNNSAYDIGAIRIIFLVYNGQNQIIAASQRDEFTVARNTKRDYIQTWPGVSFPVGATVKVITQTNTIDPNNLKFSVGSTGPASDLGR